METPEFRAWLVRLGKSPDHMHRKHWEWVYITQALHERGMLQTDRRGLGFAVGEEPLASLFCDLGAEILATDLDLSRAEAAGWVGSNEHAKDLAALNRQGLCGQSKFESLCTFRNVDMTDIPSDLEGFDFVWSACALEHLGSLDKGIQFIHDSVRCLRPGGVAIHTTEYNYSSNDDTVAEGGTVLYRQRDIQGVVETLRRGVTM